mmetsp:Transcript_6597/g.25461  ORF Transcript_6597/g.25461 Transcript_6597/m.25461 type:complete len:488 (-) Transcript_6597:27-1490(-)
MGSEDSAASLWSSLQNGGPLGQNPVFQGGLGLAVLGAAASVARRSAGILTQILRRQFLMTLEITSKDASYPWVLQWLNAQGRQSQHLSVQTASKGENLAIDFVPGPGRHYIFYRNRFFLVEREREHQTVNMTSGIPWERLTFTALGRDPDCFAEVLKDAKAMAMPEEEGTTTIYTSWGTDWRPFGAPVKKRPLSSVVLHKGVKEGLLDDLGEWHQSREWYRNRGIPYRRGYLLYGPPGSGKSSFIMAIAGHFNYGICMLSLSDDSLTDDRLALALSVVPKGCIVVLEDVDAAFVQRRSGSGMGVASVTFSGLLNCLDGVLSGEDRIIFMTTNHIDRLDPALIRPGRVDMVQYLGDADSEQVARFFKTFYGGVDFDGDKKSTAGDIDTLASMFAQKAKDLGVSLSMAHLQGYLLHYKADPERAVEDTQKLQQQVLESQAAVSQRQETGNDDVSTQRPKKRRQLTAEEVDRMVFNPQEGWEEQCGLKEK